MNMPVETFLTALYTIVDDWYKEQGAALLVGKAGTKPLFSDSEVLTLSLAQHWMGVADEREWLRYMRNNYLCLFPRLVSQSQFNRRARCLCWLMNRMRRSLVEAMGAFQAEHRLVDGTPIHIRHWRRFGKGHLMLPHAALGYCAAKKETFYGYRLVVLTTLDGIITDWGLLPANADEREGALDLLFDYQDLVTLGDKGFLDAVRQMVLLEEQGILLLTPKRKNQKQQNPIAWDAWMNRVRRMVETTFSAAKGHFGLEAPQARELWGVLSRLIAKLTGMTIAAYFNKQNGRSPLELAEFAF
jgi:DDE family transposase